MAIEYVEIRDINREIIGIVDTAKSLIWHEVYYGVGDFEIYAKATPEHLFLLVEDRYITRPESNNVGIIEKINIVDDLQDGRMIIATGRFAKSILERRLIYNLSGKTNKPTILRGNVEVNVRNVVSANAINCAFDSKRNISMLELGTLSQIPDIIVDDAGNAAEKQVSYQNLLEYTDGVLQEYGLSAVVLLDTDNVAKKLKYVVLKGVDRSADNTAGLNPIIFSKEYDNLTDSEYSFDTSTERNVALIGGEGEGLQRFYSLIAPNINGLARRELFVDASSINKKYKDDSDVEHEYTDAQYKTMLDTLGKQTLAPLIPTEIFNGTINVTSGNYILNRDFWLGDIVTVQENSLGLYINVRITETTEIQDENGYKVEVKYE